MEELWEYVTPNEEGVDTTQRFYESLCSYLSHLGLKATAEICDIPEDKQQRPAYNTVVNFINQGLLQDVPVAFLNLCNGEVVNLEAWHWVTIISIEYAEKGNALYADILDEGAIKSIDLKQWYDTTALGGGFVYFKLNDIDIRG
jgi:hypothetical protein